MNEQQQSRSACKWRDTSASFVLGALPASERVAFSEHLIEGCGACGEELAQARQAAAAIDLTLAERDEPRQRSASQVSRRARVRERLLTGLSAPSDSVRGAGPSSVPGVALIPDSALGWEETDVPGVTVKHLAMDSERHYATSLYRMAPATVYPGHRHAGREECYVISGDLSFGGHRLVAGDYQVAETGSIHPEQSTEEGCLLLIVASALDERLPG